MNIVITNHTGSRNRGCEALVLSKILGLKRVLKDSEFQILTHDPLYDAWRFREYGDALLSYLTKTPEHSTSLLLNKVLYKMLSVLEKIPLEKKIGVKYCLQRALAGADLIVPSGGDIFTSDYHNLRKHLSILLSSPKKSKLYLCSHTVGPLLKKDESYFKEAMKNVDLITVRESESFDYLKSLNVDIDVHLTADVAFTLPSLPKENAKHLLKSCYGVSVESFPLVAISISQGIIKYSGLDQGSYYKQFARLVDYLNQKGRGCLLIPHVMESNPNNNDVIACNEVMSHVSNKKFNRIVMGEPSAVDFKGVIGLCEALIGTRTHATIASLSQNIPTVAIAYSRKAYGIMTDIFGGGAANELVVSAKKMSSEVLISAYEASLINPPKESVIKKIKSKAEENFTLVSSIV